MSKKIIWQGDKFCGFCHVEIHDLLFDCKLRKGPWATLCESCYGRLYGIGLGIGLGQKYQEVQEGVFEQIEGGSSECAKS